MSLHLIDLSWTQGYLLQKLNRSSYGLRKKFPVEHALTWVPNLPNPTQILLIAIFPIQNTLLEPPPTYLSYWGPYPSTQTIRNWMFVKIFIRKLYHIIEIDQ